MSKPEGYGVWRVVAIRGHDNEGNVVKTEALGAYEGHLADLAFQLAAKGPDGLYFHRMNQKCTESSAEKVVMIQVDNGPDCLVPTSSVVEWYKDAVKDRPQIKVTASNISGFVYLERPMSEVAPILARQARAKLTAAEWEALLATFSK